MQPMIGDYALLSDCHSAALVARSGSVDWWCVPRFDSPSVFGALLDPEAGSWTLHPVGEFTATRRYLDDSLVLETTFTTPEGVAVVTDALLFHPDDDGHEIGKRSPHVLNRRVEGLSGSVAMRTRFAPRTEYGRTTPDVRLTSAGVHARGGPVSLNLTSTARFVLETGGATATFTVTQGLMVPLRLAYAPTFGPALATAVATTEATLSSWTSWAEQHTSYDGAFPELVRRSSVVLQGLTYAPSGAVVAAATTSLPETMGGELNWDYRYAWLRDLSLTMRSLWLAACPDEPQRLFAWLAGSTGHLGEELVQIMYGVEGERDLTEHTLDHLAGYRGSSPVRVGNDAWQQKQLDVVGEVLDAAHLLMDTLLEGDSPLDPATQELLVALADRAASSWEEPDAGMWEARDAERHYTSSKVMCWVALDRALQLAPHLGPSADPDQWAESAAKVRAAVLTQAWSEELGAYAGAFGSDDLDASVLLLPLVGFLPAEDPRMRATIEAIAGQLGENGLVRRWPEDRSGFLICTYWLVECLALLEEHERAMALFEHATGHANDIGLLAEEADPASGELLGNYPQAFSHVGLINAAWRLGQASTAHQNPKD